MESLDEKEIADAEATVLARECGWDLNEALTVAMRRADDSARAWERWQDGQSALYMRRDAAIVRAIEARIRGER